MNQFIKINLSKRFNVDIYYNNELINYFNSYNYDTSKLIDKLKGLYTKSYFLVPSKINYLSWGYEKVFYPFSNKLFKIINTNKGSTSLQLHPLKSEQYISLSDNTKIFDGETIYNLKYNKFMKIPKSTVHRQLKDSIVFEEQDNIIFDNNETIRILDDFGRKTHDKRDCYKYLLPQNKNNIQVFNKYNIHSNKDMDKFVFLIDGYVIIEINKEEINLDQQNELYFISSNVLIKNIVGNVYITNCYYYEVNNE